MRVKRLSALILCLALALSLAACGLIPGPSPSPDALSSDPPPSPAGEDRPVVNLTLLKGPTGVGAAKLLADDEADATAIDYVPTICTENSEVVARLSNGDADIAAIATNVAANYFHKTDEDIQLLAINTLGVLYILERGAEKTVRTVSDLSGRTLYATGQGANPEYVLQYLLRANGLEPGEDVEVLWRTADEISALMLTEEADLCMLPVPAATALQLKSAASSSAEGHISPVIDLTEAWNEVTSSGTLAMGCVVARRAFVEEHPDLVDAFLEEYAASIAFVRDNPEEAAPLVAQFGITPNAAIAQAAIPACNLVCITGRDARNMIQGYYEVLAEADLTAIGGSIPNDAFYYIP
ncbi:MAG: ABC transporter substrate-binding protein [Clostridiales bacterium]|nr:ABC transporter substrate-binding protein [Clostridiales bacterium]